MWIYVYDVEHGTPATAMQNLHQRVNWSYALLVICITGVRYGNQTKREGPTGDLIFVGT